MSLRLLYYLDEQMRPALAEQLRSRNSPYHRVAHVVQHTGLRAALSPGIQ